MLDRLTLAVRGPCACAALALAACGPAGREEPPRAAAPGAAPAAPADRMATELQKADERAMLCSSRGAVASGLRAEYFADAGLAGTPGLVRQEGPIEHEWPARADSPAAGGWKGVRWSGWVKPAISGAYAFHVEPGPALIKVSGQLLLDGAPVPGEPARTVQLSAGRFHPITVELRQPAAAPASESGASAPLLRLSWTAPHGARFLVPKAALFPPSDTVAAPAREAKADSPARP